VKHVIYSHLFFKHLLGLVMIHRRGVRRSRSYQRYRKSMKTFNFSHKEDLQDGEEKYQNSSRSLSPGTRIANSGPVGRANQPSLNSNSQDLWTPYDCSFDKTHCDISLSAADVLASSESKTNGVSEEERQREASDDQSLSSSASSYDNSENLANPEDMIYSLSSNLLFLAGACVQTAVAIWDVIDAISDANEDAAEDDNTVSLVDDLTDHQDLESRMYSIMTCVGPFLYIMNAIVDVKWAVTLPPTVDGEDEVRGSVWAAFRNVPLWNFITQRDDVIVEDVIMEKLSDFATGITFGIAALFEFYGTFFDEDENATHVKAYLAAGYKVNMVAMHTYLLSGIFAVQKDRTLICYPGGSLARRLIACGMILFLTGSILDCVIAYLYNPKLVSDNNLTDVTLSWCNLASTLLWNVDAVFYVLSDFIVFPICETKFFHPCRTVGMCLKQHCARERHQRSSLEMPMSLALPFIPKFTKSDHRV